MGHSHSPRGHSHVPHHDEGSELGEACTGEALLEGGGKSREAKQAQEARSKLLLAMIFCFLFMGGEVAGGLIANSLAILTDAAHLLSDVAGFLISMFAVYMAEKAPTSKLTFGYHRVEIFGALISVLLIWALTGVLIAEAIDRIRNPVDVDGKIMFIVACCGLAVNIGMMKILHQAPGGHGHSHGGHSHGGHGHSHGGDDGGKNINVQAAFIHVIGDLIQSVGVMIAAALIWWKPSLRLADPICTFLFSILVLTTTITIIKQAVGVLMNTVPSHLNTMKILSDFESLDGVANVHDLHIWSISQGKPALSVHIVADDGPQALKDAQAVCRKHKIKHTTIQIERCGTDDLSNCHAVNNTCEMSSGTRPDGRCEVHGDKKLTTAGCCGSRPPPGARTIHDGCSTSIVGRAEPCGCGLPDCDHCSGTAPLVSPRSTRVSIDIPITVATRD